MVVVQDRLLCLSCKKGTLHARSRFSGAIGCILTFFTGCFFLPVWGLIFLIQSTKPMRCQVCGLAYSAAAVDAFQRKRLASGQPATPTAPVAPPLDWAKVAAAPAMWIRSAFVGLADYSRAVAGEVAVLYRKLPDWATPIVWAMGFTGPIAVTALLGRYLEW